MVTDGSPTGIGSSSPTVPLTQVEAVSLCSAPAMPDGPCPVCPRLQQEFEPYRLAHYYKALHRRALQRLDELQEELSQTKAKLRLREQQLFGRQTEAGSARPEANPNHSSTPPPAPRPRGQQAGRPGPRRRDHSHLPVVVEDRELPEDQRCCQGCGQPFADHGGTEDSTILEIEVKAHRRLIRRRRYRPTCTCGVHPQVVTAPPAPRLIPKSHLGVSIWVTILIDKYLFYRPTYRLLADLHSHGLDLSLGTITDGLQRLAALFEPLYQVMAEHSRAQPLWHGDETRWLVFASVEGKVGYRWYLWVFHSEEVVVFVLAQGRAHDVPEDHLGPDAQGILVVDRYKAYQAIDQVKRGLIVLAFCWAHVRRDFLTLARTWPTLETWALGWVDRIGAVYQANAARLAVADQADAYASADAELRQMVTALGQQGEQELAREPLHPAQQKVLTSLGEHWTGLTVFVEHPEVPMDNNTAERTQRGPVVGRKNYYGSGAVWSGRLAAMLFSLFQTLSLWNLNARAWLTWYLTACAEHGGQAPADISNYLPWKMSAVQRQALLLVGEHEPEDTS